MNKLPLRQTLDEELKKLQVEPALARRICRAVRKEEEAPMKKRFKLSLSIALVLLAALLLASVTFALSDAWGVMDFFTDTDESIRPLDGTEEQIRQNLGSAEDERMRMEIREALFDGKGVEMVIEISPKDKEHWLYSDWTDYTDEEINRPGKIELTGFPAITINQEDVESYMDVRREGEGLVYYLSGWTGETVDQIVPTVSFEGLSVETRLSASQGERLKLIPGPQPDGLEILEADIFSTPLANYLTVRYRAQHGPGETDPQPYKIDPELTYYGNQEGRLFHRVSDCSGMENARRMEADQLEGKTPCPLCVGESDSGPSSGLSWKMELLDAEHHLIKYRNSNTRVEEQEDNAVYTKVLICQAGDLTGDLILRAGDENITYDIRCQIEKVQAE